MTEKEERGKRLQEAIKYAHTSQTALAEALFITRQNINKICKGKTLLTDRNAIMFAEKLGVNADYLMLKSDHMTDDQKKISLHNLQEAGDSAEEEMFEIQNTAARHYLQFLQVLFGVRVDLPDNEENRVLTAALLPFRNMEEITSQLHPSIDGVDSAMFESFLCDTWEYINLRLEKLTGSNKKTLSLASAAADRYKDSVLDAFPLSLDVNCDKMKDVYRDQLNAGGSQNGSQKP